MRRALAWILLVLVIYSPTRAYAEPLGWRAVPTATQVDNVKSGTAWGQTTNPGFADDNFGYLSVTQQGTVADTAGGDNYDSLFCAAVTPAAWILRPYELRTTPGTYTTVSTWSLRAYRADGTIKALRVWPLVRFDVARANSPGVTDTVQALTMSSAGYWPDQAAPQYSTDATSAGGLDWRDTNDTEPADQVRNNAGDPAGVASYGLLALTYRPRVGSAVWDVYYALYAHVSGSSATDYRATVGSFSVDATTSGLPPFDQTDVSVSVPGLVRLCDPQGIPPDYSPAALVQGDANGVLERETYYSFTSAASDRVAGFVNAHEGVAWDSTQSVPPTTSVPPTQSVPATATTPSVPPTTTPGGDWYAVFTNAVAPLRSLLWPLDLFGRLAGK